MFSYLRSNCGSETCQRFFLLFFFCTHISVAIYIIYPGQFRHEEGIIRSEYHGWRTWRANAPVHASGATVADGISGDNFSGCFGHSTFKSEGYNKPFRVSAGRASPPTTYRENGKTRRRARRTVFGTCAESRRATSSRRNLIRNGFVPRGGERRYPAFRLDVSIRRRRRLHHPPRDEVVRPPPTSNSSIYHRAGPVDFIRFARSAPLSRFLGIP